jgi:hypothetical protein
MSLGWSNGLDTLALAPDVATPDLCCEYSADQNLLLGTRGILHNQARFLNMTYTLKVPLLSRLR